MLIRPLVITGWIRACYCTRMDLIRTCQESRYTLEYDYERKKRDILAYNYSPITYLLSNILSFILKRDITLKAKLAKYDQ